MVLQDAANGENLLNLKFSHKIPIDAEIYLEKDMIFTSVHEIGRKKRIQVENL